VAARPKVQEALQAEGLLKAAWSLSERMDGTGPAEGRLTPLQVSDRTPRPTGAGFSMGDRPGSRPLARGAMRH
jgi:hypothetical protein